MWQMFLVSKKISMASLLFRFSFFIEVFVVFFFCVEKHKKGSQEFTGYVLLKLLHCVMEWDHQNTNRVYHLLNPQFLELQV